MTNLIGRPRAELEALVAPEVGPAYRVRQVSHWVVTRRAASFDAMTNLPRALRQRLAERFSLAEPEVRDRERADDGTVKYLLRLDDGADIECVAMPEGRGATLCLSSQAGCALGCRFCVTGRLGSGRNLTSAEMVGQYRLLARDLPEDVERVNLVFMGMGEPLLNTENLGRALDDLTETVSPKRITVSTAGIPPGIRWLGRRERRPKLAVSLNAADQERRERLMPIAARYPLDQLMEELRRFPLERGRRLTLEWVLIRGINDGPDQARSLARLIRGLPSKVNVIPFNEDPEHLQGLHRPPPDVVDRFAETVRAAGLTVTVRQSRGDQVAAACGRLKGRR